MQHTDLKEGVADVKRASFTSMDACVEPHGGVYASRSFTQQHQTTTERLCNNKRLAG